MAAGVLAAPAHLTASGAAHGCLFGYAVAVIAGFPAPGGAQLDRRPDLDRPATGAAWRRSLVAFGADCCLRGYPACR